MVLTTGSLIVTLLSIAFLFVCLLLILLILIQRPKGGGLAGAFGGAGGSDQAMFGAKAGDALTWITVGLFVGFLLLAMGLTWTTQPTDIVDKTAIIEQPIEGTDAATSPAGDTESTDKPAADATIGDKVDEAATAVKEGVSKTVDTVKEGAAKAVEATGNVVDKTVEAVKDAAATVKTEVEKATAPATPAPAESEAK